MMATTVASHGAWKGGSCSSRSTGPNPCMPPRSWTPSIGLPPEPASYRGLAPGHARRFALLASALGFALGERTIVGRGLPAPPRLGLPPTDDGRRPDDHVQAPAQRV